ncbi:MAG: hypothetical protein ABIT20_04960 [Gemmatimonadaceae bacterium]
MAAVTKERAERIARGHACERCGEYTIKRLSVKPTLPEIADTLKAVWLATKTCGVCGLQQDIGIDDEGDIVFVG